MTLRYVGPGGSDGNDGLSWTNRKLTLNGVEDSPVVAGDTVYVGPGCYREQLTVDVSGSGSNYITYVADVTGENTDGIGGVVRITGSDDDISATRNYCIYALTKDYRKFRGFYLDTTAGHTIYAIDCTYWTIEDCAVQTIVTHGIYIDGTTSNFTIRRCMFFGDNNNYCIFFTDATVVNNANHLVENCLFVTGRGVADAKIGGVIVKNCTFYACYYAVRVTSALDTGQTLTVNNCIFAYSYNVFVSVNLGDLVEDYNALCACATPRSNVNTGSNSNTNMVLFASPIFNAGAAQISGFKLPVLIGELSEWSTLRAIAGSSQSSIDIYGLARPATNAKISWGAFQYPNMSRSTTQAQGGSVSLKFADAGRQQFIVPVTAVSTTISVYVYREANYAGTNPQMVIKQSGQSDRTTTDISSASQWNQLSDTFTPASTPGWVVVELVSNNTATSGSYGVYFDTLAVS